MKNMKSAQEFIQCAPKGRYPSVISKAEAKLSKAGDPQIALIVEIAEGEYSGDQAYDYITTDGNAKGAGMFSKPKLRALGVDVETDAEIPDAVIAQGLLGLRVLVDYDNEPRMGLNPATGKYDLPVTIPDSKTGVQTPVMNLVVKGYSRVGGAPQQLAPQGQPAAQWQQPAQPQFAAPQQPVFAPAQPQFAPAPVVAAPAIGAPPGWTQAPDGSWQQVGQAPAGAQVQTQATVPWAGAPANGAAPAAPAAGGRRGRRLTATDAPQG